MRCAIIGSGNIGTDLMFKVERSPQLDIALVVGIDPASEGLRLARERGHEASPDGIDAVLRLDEAPDIVFDATSAQAHRTHDPLLREAGVKHILDLTPAALGPAVFPTLNLDVHADEPNLSFVSCAGQATVPLVAAASGVAPVTYAETVSTIASLSAGPGTRANIDDFTRKTSAALEQLGGAAVGKAILMLNPCEPPLIMRNTIYLHVAAGGDLEAVAAAVEAEAGRLHDVVPGYRLRRCVVAAGTVRVFTEVEGSADYLPAYAGNLDIITAAAVAVAERIASRAVAA